MAADKEAVGLSRVHMYESMYILPLRDHCLCGRVHTISRQFIPLIYGPLGKEYFLKSNLLCPFTSVKPMPLVILPA